jgi:CBS domain-containing protein
LSAVSEIMSDNKVVILNVETGPSVLDAVKLMLKHKVGSVVMVNKNNRPVGIVTERDVLRKVSTTRRGLGKIKLKEIMSSPVVTIKPYDSIETASTAMAGKKIKRLVVVEQDGSMAGVLSLTDITRKLAKILADDQSRFGNLKALLQS